MDGGARKYVTAGRKYVTAGRMYVATGALPAADYLKQAAAMQKVTSSLIDHVRNYIRRAERQGDLVFAPPAAL